MEQREVVPATSHEPSSNCHSTVWKRTLGWRDQRNLITPSPRVRFPCFRASHN